MKWRVTENASSKVFYSLHVQCVSGSKKGPNSEANYNLSFINFKCNKNIIISCSYEKRK